MNNIMKIFSILATLLLLANTLHAQDVKLELSSEIRIEDSKVLTGHLHSNSSGHYVGFLERPSLFSFGNSVYLTKYDRKFKEVFSREYQVADRNVFSLGMQYFKGKLIWIQYKRDNRNDELIYYAVPIDLNGKAGKAKAIAKFKYKNSRDLPDVTWKVNQDTSRLLFIAEMDRNRSREDYSAYFAVIDTDLNKVWDNKVKFPESERQVEATSFELGAKDQLYFAAKIFDTNASSGAWRKSFVRMAEYSVNIVKVTGEGYDKYELDLKDRFIKGIKIVRNPFGSDIACAAMIGDSRSGPIQGVSYLKLDSETGDVLYAKKRNFTRKELESFGTQNTSRDRRSGDEGLDDEFIFRDVIYKKDGSYTMLAEEYRVEVRTSTTANGVSNTSTSFRNNHIITANFDAEGEVESIRMIPKKYSASKSGTPFANDALEEKTHYMFFSTLNSGDNIYYLYNDDEKNFSRNITNPNRYKTVTNFRECVAVIAHIDENGKLKRKELFKREDTGTLLMPKFSTEISPNEMLIFLKRKRFMAKDAFRFGILSVNAED